MEEENKYGKILRCMKGTGQKTKLTEEVDSFMEMGMFIRASGKMIKHMGKEYTQRMMALVILVNGLRISNMDLALRSGQMDLPTKGMLIFMKYAC